MTGFNLNPRLHQLLVLEQMVQRKTTNMEDEKKSVTREQTAHPLELFFPLEDRVKSCRYISFYVLYAELSSNGEGLSQHPRCLCINKYTRTSWDAKRDSRQPAVPVFGLWEEIGEPLNIFPPIGLVLDDEEMSSFMETGLHSLMMTSSGDATVNGHLVGFNIEDELGGHFRTVSRPCAALFDVLRQ